MTFLEKPTPISYQSSSLGVQGFLNFSQVPVVDGYAITVSNYNTGVQSDNVLVSGFHIPHPESPQITRCRQRSQAQTRSR